MEIRSFDNRSIIKIPPWVPADEKKSEIIATAWTNRVVIVAGDTGSGKTSRIPLYLHEAGYSNDGMIAVVEPRRLVATEMAEYAASLLGEKLGEQIAYRIRFSNWTTLSTRIKFLTDGMLLAEMTSDELLRQYSVIMIDEAHERSLILDQVIILLKRLLIRRPDLRLIISSATINEQRFSDYFDSAPIINVSGRMYPIDISYSPTSERGMIEHIAHHVEEIHCSEERGDILVFVAGTHEIYHLITILKERNLEGIAYLPVHATLDYAEQQRIFSPSSDTRKVIIATNIAETSITINTRLHVIDSGYIKNSYYRNKSGAKLLRLEKHSRAGCNQRAGRAGRVAGGSCRRMYSKEDFDARPAQIVPEILRSDLARTVLVFHAHGLTDVDAIDFLDSPRIEALADAYETLFALSAFVRDEDGLPIGLTEDGKIMAYLPLEPQVSRMIIDAQRYGCVAEMATIAAFISYEGRFIVVRQGQHEEVREIEKKFNHPESDALKLLEIMSQYEMSGRSATWCRDHALQANIMEEIVKTRNYFIETLEDFGIEVTSSTNTEVIMKSFAHGMLRNLFIHGHRGLFTGIFRKECGELKIHPSSGLFTKVTPENMMIVASNIFQGSQTWARICSIVRPEWLVEFDSSLFSVTESPQVSFDPVSQSWYRQVQFKCGLEVLIRYPRQLTREELEQFQKDHKRVRKESARVNVQMSLEPNASIDDDSLELLTFRPSKNGRMMIAPLADGTLVCARSVEPGSYYCRVRRTASGVYADIVRKSDDSDL